MSQPRGTWRRASELAVVGLLGFWVANFAISLTLIAAEYRSALSIRYVPMLLEAAVGGLIIGYCVAFALLRFHDRLPAKNPIVKSLALSAIALAIVTVLVEVPAKLFTPSNDPMRYFLIATTINAVRILALGLAIGCIYRTVTGHGMA